MSLNTIQNVTMSLFRMLLCYYVFIYHPECYYGFIQNVIMLLCLYPECYYGFNKSGSLPLHTVFEGRATEMLLDIFAEETGIGKAQPGTDFLDVQVCVAQIVGDVGESVLAYPVVGRLI